MMARIAVAGIFHGGPNPVFAFLYGDIRKAYGEKLGQTGRNIHFHVNKAGFDTNGGAAEYFDDHSFSRNDRTVVITENKCKTRSISCGEFFSGCDGGIADGVEQEDKNCLQGGSGG
jgi:hypothetical protein